MSGGNIVLAAGGTGGHTFPAEALARELIARGRRVTLITDKRGQAFSGDLAEADTLRIRASTLQPGLAGKARTALELYAGYRQARKHLRRLAPGAVIGFGGYPSLPTVFAAARLRIPVLIHEPNAIAGRANRLIAGRARVIATSFPEVRGLSVADRAKCVVTGTPVRAAIAALAEQPYAPPTDGKLELLVLGGSQGARIFSEVVPDALARLPAELTRRVRITQQARPEDIETARQRYAEAGVEAELKTFFADVPERLARCHLVITRSGASTIAELAAAGRPSILVPYPHAADDHQRANAEALAETGGAWLLAEPGFTGEALAQSLGHLLTLPGALTEAAAAAQRFGITNGAARLANTVETLLAENASARGTRP